MFLDGIRKPVNPGDAAPAPEMPSRRRGVPAAIPRAHAADYRRNPAGAHNPLANSPSWRARSVRPSCARSRRRAFAGGRRSPRGRAAIIYPELIGPRLVAFGIFLGAVLYAGWAPGYVGGRLTDGLESLVGAAVYVLPIAPVCLGALMLVRSELVDVRPFRIGLVVTTARPPARRSGMPTGAMQDGASRRRSAG